MKRVQLTFLLALVLTSTGAKSLDFDHHTQNQHTSDGIGNSADDLINADLSERKRVTPAMLKLFSRKGGQKIKRNILLPLMKSFLNTRRFHDRELDDLHNVLSFVRKDLIEDVEYSHIRIGQCENNKIICTDGELFADIYLDPTALTHTRYGVTVAELMGLILHQNVKHLIGEYDERSYSLSRYARDCFDDSFFRNW